MTTGGMPTAPYQAFAREKLGFEYFPKSKNEEFNMEEFAYALEVELEHGKIRDANLTYNHPFLTAMVVLAHMSETVTYYRRLKVMETEGAIFEIRRKLDSQKRKSPELMKMLYEKQVALDEAKADLNKRLELISEIPVLDKIEG